MNARVPEVFLTELSDVMILLFANKNNLTESRGVTGKVRGVGREALGLSASD